MTKSSTRFTLMAILLLGFASTLYAGPVDCATTPSDPACAPTLTLSYHPSGPGPVTLVSIGTPVFINGSWQATFTPQLFPTLFTGGSAETSPDPFVGFSLGVINTTNADLTFSFSFSTPFSGGPYTMAQTIFTDVLMNTALAGTESVTPFGDSFIMESDVNGVLIPGFGRGTGCTTAPSPLFFCQSGAIGAIGPVAYFSDASGTLTVSGSFTLTSNTQYTLTGRTELLAPVPEPGTMLLLGSGFLGLAGFARRKMNL